MELRILVSLTLKSNKSHFIYYMIRFFSFCVGNIDFEYVQEELNQIEINHTILEKMSCIFTKKLKEMKMSSIYINDFH